MLKKKINFRKFEKQMMKKKEAQLGILSEEIISKIVERTQSGFDTNLKPFIRYDEKTIKKKGSSIVNLKDTGKMLRSIRSKRIKNGLRFFLLGSRKGGLTNNDIAYYNQLGGKKGKYKRKFFGTDRNINKWIQKKLAKL